MVYILRGRATGSHKSSSVSLSPGTMSSRKIILVIGATGAQGLAVINALLQPQADGSPSPYAVRALTRNPDHARAQELTRKGVEVVKGERLNVISNTRVRSNRFSNRKRPRFWQHRRGPQRRIRCFRQHGHLDSLSGGGSLRRNTNLRAGQGSWYSQALRLERSG